MPAKPVPCQCVTEKKPVLDDNGHCEWCCGGRQVTERVRAAQVESALVREYLSRKVQQDHKLREITHANLFEVVRGRRTT